VTIAFLGDIMSLWAPLWGRLRCLVVEDDVREWLRDCDALVANFEGVLIDRRRFFVGQPHHPSIIEALAATFSLNRTFLSVANNHAADFGPAAFDRSVATLARAGVGVFGSRARPVADVAPGVRLIGGTMWSNRPGDSVTRLGDALGLAQPGAANIVFAHWGYELEAYPRRAIVKLACDVADSFEAIVGHHSHTPQPITVKTGADGRVRPIAFSLGNFCFGSASPKFRYGEILLLELGTTRGGAWAVGGVRWSFLRSRVDHGAVRVGLCPAVPGLDATRSA
jgi:poly-gamma-glutamate capsule biosynthesis protein CapA/YwtB (metallophosphatase superfamily)